MPNSGAYAPKALPIADGVALTPTLGVSLGHTDNVGLAPKAQAQRSGVITLTPKLLATTAYRASRYAVGYQGELIRYPSSSRDNANNHELAATAENVLDTRFAVNSRLSYQDKRDAAGTTDRAAGQELDHWRGLNGAVLARYGAPGAKGRLELELGAFDKKYVNNRTTTQDADYLSTNLAARFGVRVMPKTTVLVEYRNTRFDYKRNVQGLDGTEQRYLVGAEWEATALTSGSFKVGYLNKDYKSPTRTGFSGLTWEGGVSWKPLTYSTVDISTGRSATDPTGNNGDYIKSSFIATSWTHQWASYFSTRVSLVHNESDYVGTARQDKVDTLGFSANYDFRRWVRLGASYEYSKRSSTAASFDYDRNLFSLFGEFAF
ncbi:capsular polysaccharide synthesis enzyme CpsB [Piscinibacter sakaiensis]|uniref:Capsular polysaccharide synthesis enzyme CpsB n=1 Tax=Piscinibacter sakaiensis TaxID=1547922 RepID=A0A0K8NZ20_PISS1|nr:capsular polysaccharide synthesis enzyme CpsB [Piscinibacter sakaiensis]